MDIGETSSAIVQRHNGKLVTYYVAILINFETVLALTDTSGDPHTSLITQN